MAANSINGPKKKGLVKNIALLLHNKISNAKITVMPKINAFIRNVAAFGNIQGVLVKPVKKDSNITILFAVLSFMCHNIIFAIDFI